MLLVTRYGSQAMCLKHHSLSETAFRIGVALVGIGVLAFFGASPRAMSANPVGGAWLVAALLIIAGIILIGVHRYAHR